MKQLIVPMEIKSVNDQGEFSGYASIFENLDLGQDVVEKGAFKEIVKTPEGKVLTLFQHDSRGFTQSGGLPIGLSEVEQNSKGLKFRGELVMEDPFVQRVHIHMKKKTLNGMSIGFDVLPGGSEFTEGGVRRLKALKLWEISVVTFGMNPKARIEAVKGHAPQITTIREYEDFLRDAGGFSKAQATQLASAGWKSLQGRRDSDDAGDVKQLVDFLDGISNPNPTR